jgi:cation/acetate symporter
MRVQEWTYLFVGATFGLYLLIAYLSRVRDTKGFYVAGQGVPAIANGMATGADWMSAASFISMAGMISFIGFTGGQYLMGWTGGYVLLALLLAPYLRKFGHFTVPDFVGDRFGRSFTVGDGSTMADRLLGSPARVVAVLCAIFVSFTYVAGQMRGVGIVFSRFLEVDINTGVIIGMCIVFVYATLGGMKGITWTQVAQYWVLITAFLIPAIAISIKLTGHPLPQIGMGGVLKADGMHLLDKLNAVHADLGFDNYTDAPGWSDPASKQWINPKLLNYFCVTLALMAGTAGLPHVIVRFYTVKNVKAARWSAFWALFFIALLYLTAPATAVFARYYMIDSIQGKSREQLPQWFNSWERTGLVLWFDDGDGKVFYSSRVEDNEVFRSGGVTASADITVADHPYKAGEVIAIDDIRVDHEKWLTSQRVVGRDWRPMLTDAKLAGPDRDIMVLAVPEMAELASWIIALVAAGGLAAALSTASGLLLVISSSIAHDLFARLIDPTATEAKRLLVGRTVIGLAVVVAGIFGIFPPGFVSQVVAFAFGLAASSFFPVIVLGIFSKRVGTVPAIAGMLVGIIFTGSYIIGTVYGGWSDWCFGIAATGIGTVGMVLNFIVTLGLTPLFPPPDAAIQDMIDSVREPEGEGAAVDIEAAPEH